MRPTTTHALSQRQPAQAAIAAEDEARPPTVLTQPVHLCELTEVTLHPRGGRGVRGEHLLTDGEMCVFWKAP